MKSLLLISLLLIGQAFASGTELPIPVDLVILQDDRGEGNELWSKDNAFVEQVLAKINNRYFKTIRTEFVLGTKKVERSSALYQSPQRDLMKKYRAQRKNGRVLVVISSEEKVDSHGLASSGRVTYKPVIIMRGAVQDPENYITQFEGYLGSELHSTQMAGLFRHELGHQIAFRHIVENANLNTDNYTEIPSARARWENYLVKLVTPGRRSIFELLGIQ